MPVVDLPDDELAAVIAALRRVIRGPTSFRTRRGLDPLRAALARLEAATSTGTDLEPVPPKQPPHPKAPPAGKGD